METVVLGMRHHWLSMCTDLPPSVCDGSCHVYQLTLTVACAIHESGGVEGTGQHGRGVVREAVLRGGEEKGEGQCQESG